MKRYIRAADDLKTYIVRYVDDIDKSRETTVKAVSPEAARKAVKAKLGKACYHIHQVDEVKASSHLTGYNKKS